MRSYQAVRRRTSYVKCLLLFLISVLLAIGLAMFAAIGVIKLRYSYNGVNVSDVGMIVLAALVCLIAWTGYWATCQNSPLLIKLFVSSLIVLTCLMIMIDIIVFTQPEITHQLLTKVWENLNDHGRIEFQKMLFCCDVTSASDNVNATRSEYLSSYDLSCFKDESKYASGRVHEAVKRGDCFEALAEFIHSYMYMISGVIGGAILLNIVLIFSSCTLLLGRSRHADVKRKYCSFPIVTDVILWKRRSKHRLKQVESGIFELPPTYPTGPILQAYKHSLDKSGQKL